PNESSTVARRRVSQALGVEPHVEREKLPVLLGQRETPPLRRLLHEPQERAVGRFLALLRGELANALVELLREVEPGVELLGHRLDLVQLSKMRQAGRARAELADAIHTPLRLRPIEIRGAGGGEDEAAGALQIGVRQAEGIARVDGIALRVV